MTRPSGMTWIVVQSEPLIEGEPDGAPTIVETWGPFATDIAAQEFAGTVADLVRANGHTPHRFLVTQLRDPVTDPIGGSTS